MLFIKKICDFIGLYSPLLFILLLSISLSNNYKLLVIYYVGLILNIIITIFLKKVAFEKYNKKGNNMPSGHFQSLAYSLVFYLLSHKKWSQNYIFIFLFIAFCTFYNCITYKYHTIIEIIIGTLLGTFLAFLSINKYRDFIKN
jgi:membrane-associated phospholipid phosphatase